MYKRVYTFNKFIITSDRYNRYQISNEYQISTEMQVNFLSLIKFGAVSYNDKYQICLIAFHLAS